MEIAKDRVKARAFFEKICISQQGLVTVKNASKRIHKPRTMTIDEFQRLAAILTEPYRTMATVGVCLGLRWSEIVGLKWQDIN